MREDFQIPNFGEGPVSYEKGYLNRLVRNIEMTFRSLKAKGPINATTATADEFVTTGSLEVQRPNIPGQNIQIGPTNATGHLITGYSSTSNAKNIIYNATTDDANTVPSSGSNRHLFQIRGAEKFTIDDDGAVSVVSGWLKFPATAIPSTDPNTIDEYQEQVWTPSLTFDTPGDLAITYGSRVGRVTKVGRMVHLSFVVTTSAFTHSTASGSFRITGMPFSAVSGWEQTGTTEHQNLNLSAPYHQVNLNLQSGRTDLRLVASGASAGRVALSTTHVPSGVNLSFVGQITYEANA